MSDVLDHSADGIQEYDNPLPRWWLYSWYLAIAFSIVYCIVYPSTWFWHGTSGWTQEKQWATMPAPKKTDPDFPNLSELAAKPDVLDRGKKIFTSNCAACHGANAEGRIGPRLTDNIWKYGDADKDILTTIRKGRPGGMPAWGTFLKGDEISAVASYVHSIGNTTEPAPASPTPAPTK